MWSPPLSDNDSSHSSGTRVQITMRTGPATRAARFTVSPFPPGPGQVDTEALHEQHRDEDDGDEEQDRHGRAEAEGGAGDRLAVGQERDALGARRALRRDEHGVEDAVGVERPEQ